MKYLIDQLRFARTLWRAWWRTGRMDWARALAVRGINADSAECQNQNGLLWIGEISCIIPNPAASILLAAFDRAARLHASGIRFEHGENGVLSAIAADIIVQVETLEELQIVEEVFSSGVYNLKLPRRPLVLDVGMNSGFASLFLSSCHSDAVVLAFEPFPPTFARAKANFRLNPAHSSRIHPQQYGLADETRTMELDYSDVWSGSVGMFGVPEGLKATGNVRRVGTIFRDASIVLSEALRDFPDRSVVLKIDCEGAEYGIVRRLSETGLLERVSVILMECHRRDSGHNPHALCTLLVDSGFSCVHLDPNSADISFVYAMLTRPSRSPNELHPMSGLENMPCEEAKKATIAHGSH